MENKRFSVLGSWERQLSQRTLSFTNSILFNPYYLYAIVCPFYKWGNRSTERLHRSPEVTQPARGRDDSPDRLAGKHMLFTTSLFLSQTACIWEGERKGKEKAPKMCLLGSFHMLLSGLLGITALALLPLPLPPLNESRDYAPPWVILAWSWRYN